MYKKMVDFKNAEQLYSAEIKAALYAGGNLSKLVRDAIKTYSTEISHESVKKALVLNIQGDSITIHDVPHLVIEGEIHENLILSAALEKIIEQKISAEHKGERTLLEWEFNFQDFLI